MLVEELCRHISRSLREEERFSFLQIKKSLAAGVSVIAGVHWQIRALADCAIY
jgi:hypothetical protein